MLLFNEIFNINSIQNKDIRKKIKYRWCYINVCNNLDYWLISLFKLNISSQLYINNNNNDKFLNNNNLLNY